tara:strand:+ start:580 stop:1230 length:651 start_codon:yes stop_codon:yes gene_type:complete
MKYFRKIFFTTIFFILFSNFSIAANKFEGHGELKLGDIDIKIFLEYMSPPAGQSPMVFLVLQEKGKAIWSTYWYCPFGACQTLSKSQASKKCVAAAEKYYERTILADCLIFAKRRTIVWKNGINKGKGKESKVSSKWDEKKLRAKLTELGFLGSNVSSSSTTEQNDSTKKKKKTKKNDTGKISDEDIKKLKDLKKLLDDGILTQEEFNAQKKKLLK